MNELTQEYLINIFIGHNGTRGRCTDAIKKIVNISGYSQDEYTVFISDTEEKEECIFDNSILWIFTNKYIIKCLDYKTGEEYKILPINNISNITLKFIGQNSISIEFEYANELSILTASGFNKEILNNVYKKYMNQ